MEKIRTFIAIDFPDEIVKEVARLQSLISKIKFTGKLTELENLHLTLKFLGEIDKEKLEKVRYALQKIKFSAFEAQLANTGIFCHRGKPSIVWIKVGGKGIFDLQSKIDESMAECKFEKEKRFMSHVTIARIKYVKAKKEFKEKILKMSVKNLKFEVNKFKLIKSKLESQGPLYETIEEYPTALAN